MPLPLTATTLDSSLDTWSTTEARATRLQLLSAPDYSCFICCSQVRHVHPHFTQLFTILVARTVISCTISARFPKWCFFQFCFQLNRFSLYFCLHTSNSQAQYGCVCTVIILKENQNKYFDLGLHTNYLCSLSYPHATADNVQ